ncbi:MAG: tyrosine-type recombinase/integrase [Bacillota bacterium]|jgi:site-specific recombinase XerD|nr:tyrosine-type recombinase/integrase [Bacillota bacterium]NLM08528.1 tyrosine-type recombinase/integrase [Clostridiales Family XIII bacterium]HOA42796.1 tyrosine-type recombinase/integrase [Bacillota bacterium]
MSEMQKYIDLFLTHCKQQRRLADHSIKGYSIDLRMFMEYLESRTLPITGCSQVTKETLEDYVGGISDKYQVKTIKRKMACIRSFFSYLEEYEAIAENPFHKFRLRLREGYKNPKSLTVSEMDRFLQAVYSDKFAVSAVKHLSRLRNMDKPVLKTLNGNFFWCRDSAIVELLFAAGLRVSELCGLRFEDYDRMERSLYIKGKGNRERTLYLENAEVLAVLDNYLLMRKAVETDHSYIFITRFRDPMSAQAVRNLITKYSNIAGINKRITPHVFRHSFASLLLESGVDIKYIQEFLGHSTISTTQIYLHTSDKEKRKILAAKHPREQMRYNRWKKKD